MILDLSHVQWLRIKHALIKDTERRIADVEFAREWAEQVDMNNFLVAHIDKTLTKPKLSRRKKA